MHRWSPFLSTFTYTSCIYSFLCPFARVRLREFLPGSRLAVEKGQAAGKVCTRIVSRVLEQKHVLKQFLCDRCRKKRLVGIIRHLLICGLFPGGCSEVGHNLVRSQVLSRGQDPFSRGGRVFDCSLGEKSYRELLTLLSADVSLELHIPVSLAASKTGTRAFSPSTGIACV